MAFSSKWFIKSKHSDIQQMKEIASSSRYVCPEPVLLIIGGCPPQELEIITICVYPFDAEPEKLSKKS